MKRICVFCGSSPGAKPVYKETAALLGRLLAAEKIGLVYGGASVGLMGAVADAAITAGGEVIGVIPQHLVAKEVAHKGLGDLRVVSSMHERKALMADLSDGFIALPGGFGTFEELFEIVTWSQLGLHAKPAGILNVAGYYDSLLDLVEQGVAEGFIRPGHRDLILSSDDPHLLLRQMRDFRPRSEPKWISDPGQS